MNDKKRQSLLKLRKIKENKIKNNYYRKLEYNYNFNIQHDYMYYKGEELLHKLSS